MKQTVYISLAACYLLLCMHANGMEAELAQKEREEREQNLLQRAQEEAALAKLWVQRLDEAAQRDALYKHRAENVRMAVDRPKIQDRIRKKVHRRIPSDPLH